MPRYFFHMVDGGLDPDIEGTELPDSKRAKCEAIVYAGQAIRDRPELVSETGECRIEVTGDNGAIVTTIVIQAIEASSLETLVKIQSSKP